MKKTSSSIGSLSPFSTLNFCYPWRPYQKRVLDMIHMHLDDRRLHIVAAPGAGKTSLGLEVFRLLEKTTLVLSPTRIIRDQWIDRLKDFTPHNPHTLSWVSRNLYQPGVLTSITYQALYTKFRDELNQEMDEVLDNELDKELASDDLNEFIEIIKKHPAFFKEKGELDRFKIITKNGKSRKKYLGFKGGKTYIWEIAENINVWHEKGKKYQSKYCDSSVQVNKNKDGK